MTLEIISHIEKDKWDSIVKSFKDWDIYYLCSYAQSYICHGDGIPYLIHYSNDHFRMVYVVMQRDISDSVHFQGLIPKNEFFDWETPYGYGGPLYDIPPTEDQLLQFYDELLSYTTKKKIVSQFIRFHPISKNYTPFENICNVIHMKNTVYLDTACKEIIRSNLTKRNRNLINKAGKSGVIISNDSGANISEFIKIYNKTMDRKIAERYYYFEGSYFKHICDAMHDNLIIFYAKYNDVTIGSVLFLYNDKYLHYHLSGQLTEYQYLDPTRLIIYNAAIWAAERGIQILHLGGGLGIEDSLLEFKKQFNKNDLVEFCIGGNIFLPEASNYLVKLRQDNDSSFDVSKPYFIKYRCP